MHQKITIFSNALHQSKVTLTNKNYYLVTRNIRIHFFKGYHQEYMSKIIKWKLITFFSRSSWKSSKTTNIFLNTLPIQNLWNAIQCEFWHSYELKAWLFYIHLTYSIFSRNLGILSKSGKHSPNFNYTKGCFSP